MLINFDISASSDGGVTSGASVDIKQEEQDNIRAQFFEDLKRLKSNEPAFGAKNVDVSKLAPQSLPDGQTMSSSQYRDEEDNLPPRKRKVDIMENGSDEAGDCKKVAHDEDRDSSIKLETTSC